MNQQPPTQEQMEKRAAFLGRAQLHGFVTQFKAGGFTDKSGKNWEFNSDGIKSSAESYTRQMMQRASNATKIHGAILSAKKTS